VSRSRPRHHPVTSAALNLPVIAENEQSVCVITLNRPEARNALTPEMLCRLADAFVNFAANPELRVAIVTGAGDRAFCAGGDLATTIPLLTGERDPQDAWDRRLLDDPSVLAASGLRDFALHKPVIAAVNGVCMAAGFELLLGTDIRIAATNATFALPEVRRGVVPFAGSMARLPRQIGYCRAMELLLTGDPIDADTAREIGLVNRVVEPEVLMRVAHEFASRIAANGPLAVQRLKQTVIDASGRSLDEAYLLENACKAAVMASEDAREGPRAFIEKRQPRFKGH
jgi:enoyl-CoA hydratase